MFLCLSCEYKRINKWISDTSRIGDYVGAYDFFFFYYEKRVRKIKVLIELKYRYIDIVKGETMYRRRTK